ncbi:MAG TPA: BTAD domain-containing putative transcriptional regulator [Gemmatimonadaceae bacterium]|nr:BTAD domain-containing putative transcriptional regulator [Gemmatimonadaceae bacterium]
MFWLQLLGGCALRCDGEPLSGPAVQPRRLALFALAASHRTGLTRDKITACLWPDEDRERARHFLADSLFTIRKSLGRDVFISTSSDIRVNPQSVCTDLWMFEDAFARRDFASAASLYHGPFLDGFFIGDAPEFERWAESERARLANAYGSSLEHRAEELERDGDYDNAVEWWTRLSLHDPYSSRITVRTMTAQEKSGDAVSAIRHAAKYAKLVHDDLDLAPDPDVLMLAEKLRSRLSVESPVKRRSDRPDSSSARDLQSARHEVITEPPVIQTPPSPLHVNRHHRAIPRRMMIATSVILTVAVVAVASRVYDRSSGQNMTSAQTERATLAAALKDPQAKRTRQEEAQELYHEGRQVMTSAPMSERFDDAMALFRRAVEVEPTFAPAYAAMSVAYSYKGDYAHSKEAALKALSLDNRLPEAHTALAYVLAYYEHHWHAADSELVRAIQASPRFAEAMLTRAYIQAVMDHRDSAVALAELAESIEPDSWIALFNRAMIESAAGRPTQAIKHFEAALNIQPERPDVKLHLAMEYRTVGQTEAAAAILKTLHEYSYVAVIARGDPAEMRSLIHQYERDSVRMNPSTAARLYAQLGEKDAAFRELRKAFWSDRYVPLFLRHQPLASLRTDPRYARLVKDLGMNNDAEAIPRPMTK